MATSIIEKKFLFYQTQAAFDTDLQAGFVKSTSIAFIKDKQWIWTNGQYFYCNVDSTDNLALKADQTTTLTISGKTLTLEGGDKSKIQLDIEDIDGLADAIAASATTLEEKEDGHVTVTESTAADGHKVYTIAEDDIASAALLGTLTDVDTANTAFGKIAAEKKRAEAAEKANKDAIDLLNEADTEVGSVAYAVKNAKESVLGTLESTVAGMKLDEVSTSGKAIVKVSQSNGVVSAETGDVAASNTTFAKGEIETEAANVQAALVEIYGKIDNNKTAGTVKVWEGENEVTTIAADGKTYTIKQGETVVASINIAKDMVVSGGSVVTAVAADKEKDSSVVVGEKYIRLAITNSEDVLYIPVNSLYKDHTGSEGTKIVISISDSNVISASIVAGSIEKTDLVSSLQTEISNATSDLETIKGTGEGSITKALQDAKDYSDTEQRFIKGGENQKNAKLKDTNLNVTNEGELAIGKYNTSNSGADASSKTAFSIGNGTESARSNAFEVREDGSIWMKYDNSYKNLQTILGNEIDWYEGE